MVIIEGAFYLSAKLNDNLFLYKTHFREKGGVFKMDSSKRMSFIREENLIERLQYYQVFSNPENIVVSGRINCMSCELHSHLVTDLHNFSLSIFLP